MTRKVQILTVFFFYSANHNANSLSQRKQEGWQRSLNLLDNEVYNKRVSHLLGDPVHHWRS